MIRPQTLLAAALLSVAVAGRAAAQAYPTDRGSFIVSGSAGAHTSVATYDDRNGEEVTARQSGAYVAPQVQYFVTPGLAVGGQLTGRAAWAPGYSNTEFGIGPQLSYYFGRGERRVYPYISGGMSYDGIGEDLASFGRNARAGLTFMVSREVGIDSGLYYRGYSADGVRQNTFGLAFGVTAFAF